MLSERGKRWEGNGRGRERRVRKKRKRGKGRVARREVNARSEARREMKAWRKEGKWRGESEKQGEKGGEGRRKIRGDEVKGRSEEGEIGNGKGEGQKLMENVNSERNGNARKRSEVERRMTRRDERTMMG